MPSLARGGSHRPPPEGASGRVLLGGVERRRSVEVHKVLPYSLHSEHLVLQPGELQVLPEQEPLPSVQEHRVVD